MHLSSLSSGDPGSGELSHLPNPEEHQRKPLCLSLHWLQPLALVFLTVCLEFSNTMTFCFQVRAVQMKLNKPFFFKTKGERLSPRPESPLMKLSQGRAVKSHRHRWGKQPASVSSPAGPAEQLRCLFSELSQRQFLFSCIKVVQKYVSSCRLLHFLLWLE